MNRRHFLSTSSALAPLLAGATSGAATSVGAARPMLIELRRYRLLRSGASRFGRFVEEALVPALGRAGHGPVGVFDVSLGADSPTLHLLVPHADAASVASLPDRLEADPEYRRSAAALLALPASDPPYQRCHSSLIATVPTCPAIERPLGNPGRIFELRTYRSHSEPASLKKIAMFEVEGELAIFRRVGLHPVFFGRDLVGEGLPSLTYLLGFADSASREKAWAAFAADPEWQRIRALPGYADAEIVSGITAVLLRPAAGSQI